MSSADLVENDQPFFEKLFCEVMGARVPGKKINLLPPPDSPKISHKQKSVWIFTFKKHFPDLFEKTGETLELPLYRAKEVGSAKESFDPRKILDCYTSCTQANMRDGTQPQQ